MPSLLWECLHLLTLRISAAGNYTLFRTHFNASLYSAPVSSTNILLKRMTPFPLDAVFVLLLATQRLPLDYDFHFH